MSMTIGSLLTSDFKNQPYWWDRAPPLPVASGGTQVSTDVAIVGSGLTALSAALTLLRAGRDVVVFDSEDPGFGASRRNAGYLGRRLKKSFPALMEARGHESALAVYRELDAALQTTRTLISDEGIDCHTTRCGRFIGATSRAHYDKMAKELDTTVGRISPAAIDNANIVAICYAKCVAVRFRRFASSDGLSRDCAMNRRTPWFLAIAMLSLLGTTPVLAWNGTNRVSMPGLPSASSEHVPPARMPSSIVAPRIMARHIGIQDRLHFHRHAQSQNGLPIVTWPYSLPFEVTPTEIRPDEDELPTTPQIIVMSGLPDLAPERIAPEAPPDYDYVAGCRAIPNGYHCEVPHKQAPP